MKEYVKKAMQGNKDAFVYITEQSKQRLFRVAYAIVSNKADAEDCLSESILKAYQSIHKLKNEEYFDTWITRIVINQCKDCLKKNKPMTRIDNLEETLSENHRNDLLVQSVMGMLAIEQRQIVSLKVFGGYTFFEIGQLMGMNENTVKTKYYKAMETLEQRKEEYYD